MTAGTQPATTTMPSKWSTLPAMLEENAARFGSRVAVVGDDNATLTHRQLLNQVAATVEGLNALGIGRSDRVAIALPQGPDLAVAFLAVAAGATAAPLNPACLEDEVTSYLQSLQARAVILPLGADLPARAAARSLGVPVIELLAEKSGRPGHFCLSGLSGRLSSPPKFAEPADIALMLRTSGTTSRPRIVPLTHASLCASARHVGATLELQPTDICLNAMPLFHIHGLVACVLAPLGAGGSTVCTRTFQAAHFPGWLSRFKPTWYSAVPTMHQAILAHLQTLRVQPARSSLRFIRSSSAALPPVLMAGLERLFGVPVIESYGMTEASHQIASNPLPPGNRKPGSVGLPDGPEVVILNEDGGLLENGRTGEVAVRGPNVTRGYLNNPDANATAYSAGWFRTGDQGYLDPDGYLFITGRLKELIYRGGENIAPCEIEEALLAHPGVRQAVAFAVPHPSLGEDIAIAVVLEESVACDEAELREFALDRLPLFKAPSRIVIVSDIPEGPTGKLQRSGLADRLVRANSFGYEIPVSSTENLVAATIADVLGQKYVGRHDNFFELGGDSLRATQVLARLQRALAIELPASLLFRLPTPCLLTARLDELVAQCKIQALAEEIAKLSPAEQTLLLNEASPSAN